MAVALPVALLLIAFLAPASIRERFSSMLKPGKVDSNQHRIVTWRTGLEMIRAHPWFGLGPEEVKLQFNQLRAARYPAPAAGGLVRPPAQHLSAIRGRARHSHHAADALDAGRRSCGIACAVVWRLPPGRSDLKFVLHGAVAVVIATMIAGIFEYNLGDSEVLTMFLVVVACAYAAMDITDTNTDVAVA